jgi:NhaP-type Na+/H+ or K+/H+ antiporter
MVEGSTIGFGDWMKMLFFWFLMIISRVIMVFTFYPALKKTGYGITMKETIILIYGGLRGAIGMCLSLFVAVD